MSRNENITSVEIAHDNKLSIILKILFKRF